MRIPSRGGLYAKIEGRSEGIMLVIRKNSQSGPAFRRLVLATLFCCLHCPQALAESGRTVIDYEYQYEQVRVRPTYNPNIKGVIKVRLILLDGKILTESSNSSGKYSANWGGSSSPGQSWKFVSANQVQSVRDWPQSITTTTITTDGKSSCRLTVDYQLKPGFSEYKTPMLSKDQFGFYSSIRASATKCAIHNEE
jgi:hypothetical protein